jgi:hypothetical protein
VATRGFIWVNLLATFYVVAKTGALGKFPCFGPFFPAK